MRKFKHDFTCPDVVFLLERQKKINRWSIAINLLFLGGLWGSGIVMAQREKKELEALAENPVT